MNKINLLIIFIFIICINIFTNNLYSQDSAIVFIPNFELYSPYKNGMGGLGITNIYNSFGFLDNPALNPYTFGYKNMFLSINFLYPINNLNKLYPYIDNFDIDNRDYIESVRGLSGNYNNSNPIEFVMGIKYFYVGILTNRNYNMVYEDRGVLPALNFNIYDDFLIAFGLNFPIDTFSDFLLNMGIKVKYLDRKLYSKRLADDDLLDLSNYIELPANNSNFQKITEGYSRLNGVGFDFGLFMQYNHFMFGFSYLNFSLPYDENAGMNLSIKQFDELDKELPKTDTKYIIPSEFSFSLAFHMEKFSLLNFINNIYFGIDMLNIFDYFEENFKINIGNINNYFNIGMHLNLFDYINIMMGSDVRTFSMGIAINIFSIEAGISYNFGMVKTKAPTTNYFGFMILCKL